MRWPRSLERRLIVVGERRVEIHTDPNVAAGAAQGAFENVGSDGNELGDWVSGPGDHDLLPEGHPLEELREMRSRVVDVDRCHGRISMDEVLDYVQRTESRLSTRG